MTPHHIRPELCNVPRPSFKGRCDLFKGHDGPHHSSVHRVSWNVTFRLCECGERAVDGEFKCANCAWQAPTCPDCLFPMDGGTCDCMILVPEAEIDRERERIVQFMRKWAEGPTTTARCAVLDVALRIELGEHRA